MKKLIIFILLIASCFGWKKYQDNIKDFLFWQINKEKITQARSIPDSFWEEQYKDMPIKNKYKIAIFTSDGGDWAAGQHIKNSAEKMGWEAKLFFKTPLGNDQIFLEFNPDLIIFTPYLKDFDDFASGPIAYHKSKKYFWFSHPLAERKFDQFITFKVDASLSSFLNKVLKLANGVLITDKEIALLKGHAQEEFYALRFFPSVQQTNFSSANPDKIFALGASWDKDRNSKKYEKLFKELIEKQAIKFYGRKLDIFGNSYKGFIGNASDIIPTIHKNGIYLLTHSAAHIKNGTPSARVFEAIAANVIIISDKNPFVIENFGNNILYFDQTAGEDAIKDQISAHLNWIKSNPSVAKEMANNCHKIFLEKFTMENQLVKLAKMHEYILLKEQNLEFPLKY